ncbi:hypothetical protein LGR54_00180 [Ancylobacter sp. Lp-2]|uniref:hypothetical protein n=1 Tax=Ancylobacter sp. Lp-2 TaxID=2881339 RepID=UPI001E32F69F|nr:hypothetical protein [Ancylobacter sp. Lp-2]MCB4767017.1 hypothetical protein [Ancylobacter sp. Lp-2]
MSVTKLERPPYVHNWVRYNYADEVKTTKALVSFVRAIPQTTYVAASPIVRDRIIFGLDRETAMIAAMSKGPPKSRSHVAKLVSAFYDYDQGRKYSGSPSYDQFVHPFPVSRTIQIPVKPLLIIAEGGQLKPLFLFGWSTMPLDTFQRRLLMTIVEDTVFSLTDFQNSDGEFICFPKNEHGIRAPEVWHRGDYNSLSPQELKQKIEIYLTALKRAKLILANSAKIDKDAPTKEPAHADQYILKLEK